MPWVIVFLTNTVHYGVKEMKPNLTYDEFCIKEFHIKNLKDM